MNARFDLASVGLNPKRIGPEVGHEQVFSIVQTVVIVWVREIVIETLVV